MRTPGPQRCACFGRDSGVFHNHRQFAVGKSYRTQSRHRDNQRLRPRNDSGRHRNRKIHIDSSIGQGSKSELDFTFPLNLDTTDPYERKITFTLSSISGNSDPDMSNNTVYKNIKLKKNSFPEMSSSRNSLQSNAPTVRGLRLPSMKCSNPANIRELKPSATTPDSKPTGSPSPLTSSTSGFMAVPDHSLQA